MFFLSKNASVKWRQLNCIMDPPSLYDIDLSTHKGNTGVYIDIYIYFFVFRLLMELVSIKDNSKAGMPFKEWRGGGGGQIIILLTLISRCHFYACNIHNCGRNVHIYSYIKWIINDQKKNRGRAAFLNAKMGYLNKHFIKNAFYS